MTFFSVLLTILWLIVVPVVIGAVFAFRKNGFIADGCRQENTGFKLMGIFMWSWLFGQLLLWCIFQFIAVWTILHGGLFDAIVKKYTICVGVLCAASVAINMIMLFAKHSVFGAISRKEQDHIKTEDTGDKKLLIIVWCVFVLLLLLQMFLQVKLAYMDVDDSFYVSEAVTIESSNSMYHTIPYTGQYTDMDYRHSLEPFPAWLAFIARITGNKVVTMAHVLLPVILLPLTYGVYALVGSRVLGDKRKNLPIYLVVMELLVMFSLYSTMVPEKFFITRIRQGKSTIASLIIPGIILCLFLILDYARKKSRTDYAVWVMLFLLNAAGCLCSTLGALLCVIPIGIVAIMMVFAYKKGWHIIPMIVGCIPCVLFAVLYMLNR